MLNALFADAAHGAVSASDADENTDESRCKHVPCLAV
jgi:hypothetical protein